MEPFMLAGLLMVSLLLLVLTIGTPTHDHFHNGVVTFEADQGNAVVAEAETWADGAEDQVLTWPAADKISKGTFIVVSGLGDEDAIQVKRAPAGTQNLLGIAFQKATPRKDQTPPGVVGTYDGSPGFPKIFYEVSVEILGTVIRELPLASAGAVTVLGASIKPHGSEVDVWEGDSTPNDSYVLKAGTPGSDATTVAMLAPTPRF